MADFEQVVQQTQQNVTSASYGSGAADRGLAAVASAILAHAVALHALATALAQRD